MIFLLRFFVIVNCLLFCLVTLVASPPEIPSNDVCEMPPTRDLPIDKVQERSFPSVALWPRWSATPETFVKYDYHYGYPYLEYNGRISSIVGDFDTDVEKARKLTEHLRQQNPDALIFFGTFLYTTQPEGTFPPDSDVWLRDANGERVYYFQDAWGGWKEYQIDFTKRHVQDKLVEMIVAVERCGIFDGVALDGFVHNATGFVGRNLHPATDAEIIEATTRILRKVRERVRDDFLIIANANRTKLTAYAEFINGSSMEPGQDYSGGYTHKGLMELDDTLTWNAKNLRFPQVNWSEVFLIADQAPDSPDNLRWVRVFTARSLVLDNGYVSVHHETSHVANEKEIWYPFWDADLGRPVGETGQLYDNREGLFIREFTNGWVVYNRSGKAQEIELSENAIGWQSDQRNTVHIVPDLDGEIYLKASTTDVNGDGVVNILDLVVIAGAFGEKYPDVNGDGIVNILDLVQVANAF